MNDAVPVSPDEIRHPSGFAFYQWKTGPLLCHLHRLHRGDTSQRRKEDFVELKDVAWNEQAREKILLDADRALQEAVKKAASSLSNADKDEVYKFLFEELKDRFVDFQPGPDLTEYAEAVANGDFSSGGASNEKG